MIAYWAQWLDGESEGGEEEKDGY
ncbi:hypothetical protein QN277_003427 [Acacia crassicarpa]|uniref:Uncharacterized protein n=1 Tax=Acacia crassicarpa TaxID=499986 RepID=A0AAE1MAU5_9FABA|nr:hypothetical protein QN277_003427 [Acacia crassicarpa]